MKRKLVYSLLFLLIFINLTVTEVAYASERAAYGQESEPQMTVHFIDVGEGDCIFIDFGEYEVLIDAGPDAAGQTVVDYIRPYVDGSLDLVIATHVHHDHIGGMDEVLKAYDVKEIIHSGDSYHTRFYRDFYLAVREEGCIYTEDEDRVIELGNGAVLRIIDGIDGSKNINDNSIITQLEYGEIKVLFVGDLEETGEEAYLSRLGPVQVLKVGHHGSATSSGSKFLSVVKPQIGIISAGYANEGKHPHIRAMRRLFQAGTSLYGTFRSGTIKMTLDKTSYSLDTNCTLQYSDAGINHIKKESETEIWR
ncbi:ComEC/Rec2 family competence protein [Sinanaerobacter sp. ZZT-01]|uniref:ComEC/Rec2 family competence protein n=1 Tax=Sinanaerobacter sp. ZZT-01 TaxID=3111540 RepID=UPI002D788E63|nr:MBL fold metallo-hydrolase [Sinanaerobacter sp. ZZT-01]WRR94464.1 MBL fold metallo-hydrolase [Sinanaerobacter sp. ZZT-01]